MTIASTPRFMQAHDWPGATPAAMRQFTKKYLRDLRSTLDTLTDTPAPSHDTFPNATTLKASLAMLEQKDLRDKLHSVRCPQLYLYGELDTTVPATVANPMKACVNDYATIAIIPNSGHTPFLSHPIRCHQKILERMA